MKKIFTLLTGLFMAAAVMAADHRPVVTISSSINYKVVVDGKSYFGSSAIIRLNHLAPGMHTIRVYEMRRGFFDRRERLVDSKKFWLGRSNVNITIDRFGDIKVYRQNGNNKRNGNRKFDQGKKTRSNKPARKGVGVTIRF
ncbi:MAG TPA: hypothetical protein PLU37_09525 [Chitinophagaceae bacterium]|nr:hypothetical protein [Chitinophagaceae bacterium]MCB9055703.1 hypothetical protein [Chitinophagales bacterium]HPG11758.1 hypothetical protein [Chitinophagaceae bacterium]